MADKNPKWVMCPLCEDVVYAGPSVWGFDRFCKCEATFVRPTNTRGYVHWNKAMYEAEGYEEPIIEFTEEYLDPTLSMRPVMSPSISDMYQAHMRELPRDPN
jgi:hypothetical protein